MTIASSVAAIKTWTFCGAIESAELSCRSERGRLLANLMSLYRNRGIKIYLQSQANNANASPYQIMHNYRTIFSFQTYYPLGPLACIGSNLN